MKETFWIPVPRVSFRKGERWTKEEKQYLVRCVRRGDEIGRMCDLLSRPYSGIIGQLQALGLLTWMQAGYSYKWHPLSGRKGFVPRNRDDYIRIRAVDVKRVYRICRQIGK